MTPKTYAQWADVIAVFKEAEDDEATLKAMKEGTLEWQSGVADRFAKKLIEAVNFRMNKATDRFQKEMTRAAGQERALVGALVLLRKEMKLLSEAVNLPVIPEKDREHYQKLVFDQADKIQSSLEDSAKRDRTGKLASIIRNHKVNALGENE